MAGKQILYETFFMKAPGRDRLRKTAQGRLKRLLSEGWHETAREEVPPDAVRIRFEREGGTRPLPPLRTKPEPPPRRTGRGGFGGPGGRGGGPGGRGGGPGGRGGGPPREGARPAPATERQPTGQSTAAPAPQRPTGGETPAESAGGEQPSAG